MRCRILRLPPRQFPRTANFMHLLTRWEQERDIYFAHPCHDVSIEARSSELTAHGFRAERSDATGRRMRKRNKTQKEKLLADALRPLDPARAGGSREGLNQSTGLYCRLSLRTDSNVIRVICGPSAGREGAWYRREREKRRPADAAAYNDRGMRFSRFSIRICSSNTPRREDCEKVLDLGPR